VLGVGTRDSARAAAIANIFVSIVLNLSWGIPEDVFTDMNKDYIE
jgi:hypothetical protein